jgi:hypothetical protein
MARLKDQNPQEEAACLPMHFKPCKPSGTMGHQGDISLTERGRVFGSLPEKPLQFTLSTSRCDMGECLCNGYVAAL